MKTTLFASLRFSHIPLAHLPLGFLAGGVAGAITGLTSRLAMRLIALDLGMKPEFSLDGTLMLVFLGAAIGAMIGVVYAVLEGFLRGHTFIKGIISGVVILGINLIPIIFGDPQGELALLPPQNFIAAFLPVYLAFGVILAYTTDRLSSFTPTQTAAN